MVDRTLDGELNGIARPLRIGQWIRARTGIRVGRRKVRFFRSVRWYFGSRRLRDRLLRLRWTGFGLLRLFGAW
jgi:hypothetical protein